MSVWLFFGTAILWLVVLALLARFVFGGVVDCFKRGTKAPVSSWIGFVIALILILLLL